MGILLFLLFLIVGAIIYAEGGGLFGLLFLAACFVVFLIFVWLADERNFERNRGG